jgi:hypothetical protein
MRFFQTTPRSLADAVIANLDAEIDYAPIATDGALRAARVIERFL